MNDDFKVSNYKTPWSRDVVVAWNPLYAGHTAPGSGVGWGGCGFLYLRGGKCGGELT
ncbi:hypothetical protein HanPI659440_Chr13g0493191 [Helianthus annuus]|nr:hypothetical protein HanPI659440_Chr13g0493191 [Helianthus annuus]